MVKKETDIKYHPQHPMTLSYEQALEIIQEYGPITRADIVKRASKLKHNQRIPSHLPLPKIYEYPFRLEKVVGQCIGRLKQNHLIYKANTQPGIAEHVMARVTLKDCLKILDALSEPYIIRKKHIVHSGGLDRGAVNKICDIIDNSIKQKQSTAVELDLEDI